jgi:hypothetical protein
MPPQPHHHPDPLGQLDDNPKRSWLLWVGAAIVILLIGAATWAVIHKDALAPGNKGNQAATQTATSNRFYVTSFNPATLNQTIIAIDPATGKQTKQDIVLNETFSEDAPATSLSTDNYSTNQPLQMSKDGNTLAYSTVEYPPLAQQTAGSEQQASNYTILAGKPGSLQTMVAGKQPGAILDWHLTADGKELYYLETDGSKNPPKATLYGVNVVTSSSRKIGEISDPSGYTYSRLSDVDSDKTVRYYLTNPDGMYEYKYVRGDDKGGLKRKQMPGDESLSGIMIDQLSPDGNHLVGRTTDNGAQINPKIVRIDVRSGSVQTLFDPGTSNVAYTPGGWSGDSEHISFTTYPFDNTAAGGFEFQLLSYDITTNAKTVFLKNRVDTPDLYAGAMYLGCMWSLDGNYLAYAQRDNLHFYDATAKKAVEPDQAISNEVLGQSGVGYGWTNRPE